MKRHTSQDNKQKQGQYFTTNASDLLSGLGHIVSGSVVCEPFAGGGDLVRWSYDNGAKDVKTFDIEPQDDKTVLNDSILNPCYDGCDTIVTNPPYLSRNKNKDKLPYVQWDQSDLYKCHLASIVASDIRQGILVLPSNFISESNSKIRDLFFNKFRLGFLRYYRVPVFDDATTGICVIYFDRWTPQSSMWVGSEIVESSGINKRRYELVSKYGWLAGRSFFEDIYADPDPLEVRILREGAGTNIVISLLTNGKLPLGAHYNEGDPIYAEPKVFTTYQVKLSIDISEDNQRQAVKMFNEKMSKYQSEYDGLFLANYMGATQKIMSRRYAGLLLSRCIKEIITNPLESLFR